MAAERYRSTAMVFQSIIHSIAARAWVLAGTAGWNWKWERNPGESARTYASAEQPRVRRYPLCTQSFRFTTLQKTMYPPGHLAPATVGRVRS